MKEPRARFTILLVSVFLAFQLASACPALTSAQLSEMSTYISGLKTED